MVNSRIQRPLKREEIVYKNLDNETLLYNPQTRAVHILNKTSLLVWELCDGNHSLEMIEKEIKEKFEVSNGYDIRGDIEVTINKKSCSLAKISIRILHLRWGYGSRKMNLPYRSILNLLVYCFTGGKEG